jgi:hypothetical protein
MVAHSATLINRPGLILCDHTQQDTRARAASVFVQVVYLCAPRHIAVNLWLSNICDDKIVSSITYQCLHNIHKIHTIIDARVMAACVRDVKLVQHDHHAFRESARTLVIGLFQVDPLFKMPISPATHCVQYSAIAYQPHRNIRVRALFR